jgi:hypothetical protein
MVKRVPEGSAAGSKPRRRAGVMLRNSMQSPTIYINHLCIRLFAAIAGIVACLFPSPTGRPARAGYSPQSDDCLGLDWGLNMSIVGKAGLRKPSFRAVSLRGVSSQLNNQESRFAHLGVVC